MDRRLTLLLGAVLLSASCGDNPEGFEPWPDGATYWVGWSAAPDTALAWSPTGNVALFSTFTGSSVCVYSFTGTGSPHQMTFSSLNESVGPNGCWAGDSGRIVYTAVRDDSTAELRWIPGSSYEVHLALYDSLPHMTPTWTPEGDSILYCTLLDGNWGLWKIAADADSVTPVEFFAPGYDCIRPSYSPDGMVLMFQTNITGSWDIWAMSADGSGEPYPVVSGSSDDIHPTWGPSAGWYAFASDRSGNFEIYASCLGSDTLIQVTDDSSSDVYPAWNPEEGYIIFSSDRASGEGAYDIFWIPAPF